MSEKENNRDECVNETTPTDSELDIRKKIEEAKQNQETVRSSGTEVKIEREKFEAFRDKLNLDESGSKKSKENDALDAINFDSALDTILISRFSVSKRIFVTSALVKSDVQKMYSYLDAIIGKGGKYLNTIRSDAYGEELQKIIVSYNEILFCMKERVSTIKRIEVDQNVYNSYFMIRDLIDLLCDADYLKYPLEDFVNYLSCIVYDFLIILLYCQSGKKDGEGYSFYIQEMLTFIKAFDEMKKSNGYLYTHSSEIDPSVSAEINR